ncbi:unnamed protein product [Rotaria sp. Silwood1]|nr:unnamed protein product [Rotaria sp. Silwood1]
MLKNLNRCGNHLLSIIILDACRFDEDNDTWRIKASSKLANLKPAFGKALTSHNLNRSGNHLLSIIILDACRFDEDNDTWRIKASSKLANLKPAFGKALTSHVNIPQESQFALIFSSDPGTVSYAGEEGGNSFFTSALLNHLTTPQLELDGMMKQVRKEMLQNSQGQQRPWIHSCLTEDFYFNQGS